jgi:hypothetical protein
MLTQNVTRGHSRSVFGFVLLTGVAYWQIVVLGFWWAARFVRWRRGDFCIINLRSFFRNRSCFF